MIVDNPGLECENMDMGAGGAQVDEVVANFDLDGAAMLKWHNHSVIATPTSSSPEIPESDNGTTLNGKRQLYSSP